MDAAEEPDQSDQAAPRGGRRKRALLAAGAVVVIAAGAAFGVHSASGGKTAATSDGTVTNLANGTNTQTFGGGTGGPGAGRFRPGAFGTISAISGSTLTVKATDGTTTKIATTAKTAVTRSTTASRGSIAVGDHVTVIGGGTTTKIAAQRITDSGTSAATDGPTGFGSPGGGRGRQGTGNGTGNNPTTGSFTAQSGTVTSISGSTITLTTKAGKTVTVTTTSATTVTRTAKSSVAALAVGDPVMVTGSTTNNVLTATAIREGEVGGFGGFGGGPGPGNRAPTTTGTTS